MYQTFTNVAKVIDSIPQETCGGSQPEFLYELSLNTKGLGHVVEIGTNVGKSTIALAFGQKEKNGIIVHSIDIYEHPDIVKNLQAADVLNFVNRIICSSKKAAKRWRRPIELLWIDGDHSYRGVRNDVKRWSKFVIEGGLIALHDYPGHRGSTEVWKALRKTLVRDPYTFRILADRQVGSIIVFEKIASNKMKRSTKTRIMEYMFWHFRNFRTSIVDWFPNLAKKVKAQKSKNDR
jgi:predicted O-methyltransferase YrrM